VALLPRDRVVRCIEARARALQGWRDELWVERLRAQRYSAGGHYAHHYDWRAGTATGGWGRVSSVMAWVDDGGDGELRGGGTEFPRLPFREDGRWARFVGAAEVRDDGDEVPGEVEGTVFKVVPGNAVFWENFPPDGSGRGYEETWHAGLPVAEGVKVGLNIWSWGRID
jgi:prolyl 4-hydroxylase